MQRVWWAFVPLLAVVAGCASHSPSLTTSPSPAASSPAAAARPAPQLCNPQAAQWAVGKTNTAKTIEEARKRSGALMARVLRPGTATTMEHNAERLNLQVDATQRITAATCG